MKIVALYRVSTDKQAEFGTSLDAQRERCHIQAAANGWSLVKEFTGSESATQAIKDRRVLQELLHYVSDHQVDAVWVIEQSRLCRGDELEVALLMRELRERKIKILVNGTARDPSSIDDGFMLGIQSLVDRTESLRIKERMGRGKRHRAEQGQKASGPAPYGFVNPGPGQPGRGTLQVVPEEASIVRKVYEMRTSGMGERQIALALQRAGVPSPSRKRWGKTSVGRILQNVAYVGTSAANVWVGGGKNGRTFRYQPTNERAIMRPNAHEPIIDRQVWDAVQALPRTPRTSYPKLLTGMLFVNNLKYSCDKTKGGSFYRAERGLKDKAWLPAEDLDKLVWYHFCTLARSAEFVASLMQAVDPHEKEIAQNEIEFITERLGKARRRLERLTDMRADGEIDKATFAAKAQAERDAIAGLEQELKTQRAKVTSLDGNHAARIALAVRRLLHGAGTLSVAHKRAILGSLVRRIDVSAVLVKVTAERDGAGRLRTGALRRWEAREVRFGLAAPEGDGTAYGPTSGKETAVGAGALGGADTSARQLDQATVNLGQVTGTAGASNAGVGHLAQAPSCWGPRGRARR